MDLDGLGMLGPGSFGPLGAKALPALIALDEALLLLGLPSAATPVDVRAAHRAALGALQAQLQAGTLDRSSFRALVERLDVAVRSALVGMRTPVTSGPATGTPGTAAPATSGSTTSGSTNVTLPAGPVTPGSVAAPGAGTPTSAPTPVPAPAPAPTQPPTPAVPSTGPGSGAAAPSGSAPQAASSEPADPNWVAPVRNGSTPANSPTNPTPTGSAPASPATGGPVGPANPADVLRPDAADAPPRTPRADATATMTALTSLPLLNQTPPTRAQHELWTAVLVPAAGTHVETATALAVTVARNEPQVAATVMHMTLTLALDDLPPDERRALLPLAAGVYDQLEAMLPRALLAGLPPRDLLGGLPLQLWAPGPDVRLTVLGIALAVVAFMVWAGLR